MGRCLIFAAQCGTDIEGMVRQRLGIYCVPDTYMVITPSHERANHRRCSMRSRKRILITCALFVGCFAYLQVPEHGAAQAGVCSDTSAVLNECISVHLMSNATAQQSGVCSESDLVPLYPGYPGYRGYLPDTVGLLEWACPDDFTAIRQGFSKESEDRANLRSAGALGIDGIAEDWTWEHWMAIEAERGLTPTCYTCMLLGPAPTYFGPDPQRLDTHDDARYLLGTPESTEIALRWFDKNGIPQGSLGTILTDYELRALSGIMAAGGYLNAEQVLAASEEVLEIWYCVEKPCQYLDGTSLCRTLIQQGGYVPTPDEAAYPDQAFTVLLGFEALETQWTPTFAATMGNLVTDAFERWQSESLSNVSTPGFGDWLRENGGRDWC